MSREEQFDFYWKEIFNGLAYNPIEFNTYRFDQSMSLPSKFNKLYEMFKVLALNNQEVMDYLKEFVETFDESLYNTIEDVLEAMLEGGRLANIVRVAISDEVILARGEATTLGERLNESDTQLAQKASQINLDQIETNVNARLNAITSGMGERFNTLAELQATYPTGTNKYHIITDNGHYYYWNDTEWISGGVWQSTALGDNVVKKVNISESVRPLMETVLHEEPKNIIRQFYDEATNGTTLRAFDAWAMRMKAFIGEFNVLQLQLQGQWTYPDAQLYVRILSSNRTKELAKGYSKPTIGYIDQTVYVPLDERVNASDGFTIVVQQVTNGEARILNLMQTTVKDNQIDDSVGSGLYYRVYSGSDKSLTPTLSNASAEYKGFKYKLFNEANPTVLEYQITNISDKKMKDLSNRPNELHVSKAPGDYQTITDAVNSAKDSIDNRVTIIVHPGVYEESVNVGGDRHLTIKGVSKKECIITTKTGDYYDAPLEISGDSYVENLTCIANYTTKEATLALARPFGYAIHVDMSGPGTFEAFNCDFISYVSSALGLGTHQDQTIKFRNCLFETRMEDGFGDNEYGAMFLHSKTDPSTSNQRVEIENCILKSSVDNVLYVTALSTWSPFEVAFYNNMLWSEVDGKADTTVVINGSNVIITDDSYGNNVAKLNK